METQFRFVQEEIKSRNKIIGHITEDYRKPTNKVKSQSNWIEEEKTLNTY